MWAQAGIISANHHRGWRERNPRAVRCTPNVTLNPVRHLSCQWCSRMKMLQHQRFYDVLNCEGHNTTLTILLNELPSYRWISLAFMPLLEKFCRDTRNKEQMQTGECWRCRALALSTAVSARRQGSLNTAQRDACALYQLLMRRETRESCNLQTGASRETCGITQKHSKKRNDEDIQVRKTCNCWCCW